MERRRSFQRMLLPATAFTALVTIPQQAPAAILAWTLSNAAFEDGGIATGYFDLDTSTNTVLDFSISTSGGNLASFPAFNYDPSNATGAYITFTNTYLFQEIGTFRQLRLIFANDLTTSTGLVEILLSSNGQGECYNCAPFRRFVSGEVVSSTAPIPEPASWALMIAGFGLIGGAMRTHRTSVRYA